MKIGVISDTHNTLSLETVKALEGVDHIIHAGDIGSAGVIGALETIAPLTAVRGNMDGAWAKRLPQRDLITLQHFTFYVLHDLNQIDLDPHAAGIDVVVSGHTHRAETRRIKETLFMNPGSASIGRYGGPLTIGIIRIEDKRLEHEIVTL
jgi:uncharacterized protein